MKLPFQQVRRVVIPLADELEKEAEKNIMLNYA